MKYKVDHDYHIHSRLSLCSNDPEQSTENILKYAKENGFKKICLTDHFWDERIECGSPWYAKQGFSHICAALPLPQSEGVEFIFGAETELDSQMRLGVSKERLREFDFLIIPTTHLHMNGFVISNEDGATPEGRAKMWMSRLATVLDMDLPFTKIGIAHLACGLIAKTRADYLKVLQLLSEEELYRVFAKAKRVGVGIELNSADMKYTDEERNIVLRPFRIAKDAGCKFYLGSDSHHPKDFIGVKEIFERAVLDLCLTENDKFYIT